MNKQISCRNIFILKRIKERRKSEKGRVEGGRETEKKKRKEGTSDRKKPPAFHLQQGLGKQQTSYFIRERTTEQYIQSSYPLINLFHFSKMKPI